MRSPTQTSAQAPRLSSPSVRPAGNSAVPIRNVASPSRPGVQVGTNPTQTPWQPRSYSPGQAYTPSPYPSSMQPNVSPSSSGKSLVVPSAAGVTRTSGLKTPQSVGMLATAVPGRAPVGPVVAQPVVGSAEVDKVNAFGQVVERDLISTSAQATQVHEIDRVNAFGQVVERDLIPTAVSQTTEVDKVNAAGQLVERDFVTTSGPVNTFSEVDKVNTRGQIVERDFISTNLVGTRQITEVDRVNASGQLVEVDVINAPAPAPQVTVVREPIVQPAKVAVPPPAPRELPQPREPPPPPSVTAEEHLKLAQIVSVLQSQMESLRKEVAELQATSLKGDVLQTLRMEAREFQDTAIMSMRTDLSAFEERVLKTQEDQDAAIQKLQQDTMELFNNSQGQANFYQEFQSSLLQMQRLEDRVKSLEMGLQNLEQRPGVDPGLAAEIEKLKAENRETFEHIKNQDAGIAHLDAAQANMDGAIQAIEALNIRIQTLEQQIGQYQGLDARLQKHQEDHLGHKKAVDGRFVKLEGMHKIHVEDQLARKEAVDARLLQLEQRKEFDPSEFMAIVKKVQQEYTDAFAHMQSQEVGLQNLDSAKIEMDEEIQALKKRMSNMEKASGSVQTRSLEALSEEAAEIQDLKTRLQNLAQELKNGMTDATGRMNDQDIRIRNLEQEQSSLTLQRLEATMDQLQKDHQGHVQTVGQRMSSLPGNDALEELKLSLQMIQQKYQDDFAHLESQASRTQKSQQEAASLQQKMLDELGEKLKQDEIANMKAITDLEARILALEQKGVDPEFMAIVRKLEGEYTDTLNHLQKQEAGIRSLDEGEDKLDVFVQGLLARIENLEQGAGYGNSNTDLEALNKQYTTIEKGQAMDGAIQAMTKRIQNLEKESGSGDTNADLQLEALNKRYTTLQKGQEKNLALINDLKVKVDGLTGGYEPAPEVKPAKRLGKVQDELAKIEPEPAQGRVVTLEKDPNYDENMGISVNAAGKITRIAYAGPADRKKLKVGSVVIKINGEGWKDQDIQFRREQLENAESIKLEIR